METTSVEGGEEGGGGNEKRSGFTFEVEKLAPESGSGVLRERETGEVFCADTEGIGRAKRRYSQSVSGNILCMNAVWPWAVADTQVRDPRAAIRSRASVDALAWGDGQVAGSTENMAMSRAEYTVCSVAENRTRTRTRDRDRTHRRIYTIRYMILIHRIYLATVLNYACIRSVKESRCVKCAVFVVLLSSVVT
jgi:hypothetical protein